MAGTHGSRPVILFDGRCNLCRGTVEFLRRRDRRHRLRFEPQQSAAGAAMLANLSSPVSTDTVILIEQGRTFQKSDAVLRAMRHLPTPWSWFGAGLHIFPRPFRDWIYDRIAHHRYRLFGSSDTCSIS